jgi:predicted ATPase/class 3 adenylate cyclase
MPDLPGGTVTFLFTDIEGSTKRWEHHPRAMKPAVERHDAILRQAIESQGGHVFRTEGDAFRAVFSIAQQALASALQAQRAIASEPWPEEISPLRVRMALHTGEIDVRDGDYVGPSLNRMARLLSAAHGGQTLLSRATEQLVRDVLPPDVILKDMGEHRLRDLIRPEQIYQLIAEDLPSEFPPLLTLDNRPNNLPVEAMPIIGREKQLAEIEQLLARENVRLVTLTGPGGTGKTRLAVQVAAELAGSDHVPDGVWFVDLVTISAPSLVIASIAQTLGLRESAGETVLDTLASYLKSKHLLLVLDNFEQVVEAAPDIAHLMQAAAPLKIIVTSRTPLKIGGEREYPVPALGLPQIGPGSGPLPELGTLAEYDAVELFIERAQAVKHDFELTEDNASAVAEICVRLDGLPLAIELAAARIKVLPPQAMLARLQSALSLLTGGRRDLPARQQTLRNAIEWSYNLLNEGEKQFFRRQAVFSGGATLDALEAVCNHDEALQVDVLDGAQALLDNSLLQQREGRDGEPRYWMLETIHEYAGEKLRESGEIEALEKAHTLYFKRLAQEVEPQLEGATQESSMSRLEDEHDNMRAALLWARNRAARGDTEAALIALELVSALRRFWILGHYITEGREQLTAVLSLPVEAEGATSVLRAWALQGAGVLAWMQGQAQAARSLYGEGLALFRDVQDKNGIASVLDRLGSAAASQGDYATARSLYQESLALFRELGDTALIGGTLGNLGIVSWYEEDFATARALFEESLAIARQLGISRDIAGVLGNLGELAEDQGDHAAALSLQKESLAIFGGLGHKVGVIVCFEDLARLLLAQGSGDRATRLMAAADTLRKMLGMPVLPADRPRYDASLAAARSLLGDETFEKLWQEGRAMTMEQAIEYAL